ncbi:Uncharacterised protein [Collinsella intestinalis]|nr:Uncharacterised protein [Collinsella intestinalis]
MLDAMNPNAGVDEPVVRVVLGKEALLGIPEICQMTGLCPVTASKLMKETGKCLQLHRRLYVLESSFLNFLHDLEVSDPCRL